MKAKVWVVDDDVAVQQSVSVLLSAFGFETHCAASAEEFLHDEAEQTADAMVVDLRLPGKSGIDLLKQLTKEGRAVPTVLISGHRDEDVLAELERFHAVCFLMKPFNPKSLIDWLSEHCVC
ncbi:response regulator [Rhodopirellula sp. JC639]|uniref:response regulator n=1 Tax=Stieleria mannarensis TaxID=2755585 RepID=UPI0016005427|nr:response regulator [Rhodopirellula sp. JC639]